jgi:hypothetical protein
MAAESLKKLHAALVDTALRTSALDVMAKVELSREPLPTAIWNNSNKPAFGFPSYLASVMPLASWSVAIGPHVGAKARVCKASKSANDRQHLRHDKEARTSGVVRTVGACIKCSKWVYSNKVVSAQEVCCRLCSASIAKFSRKQRPFPR